MRRLLFTCAVWVWASAGLAQETTLSADELRQSARTALQNGQPERTVALATALLARNAQDVSALLLVARAQRDMGEFRSAAKTARRAWRAAETDLQHYAAALTVAQALSSSGARTRAQVWLRRAAEAAPDERLKAKAIRDFRYVRDRNPWTTNLSFGVSPSSNVNNGSKSASVEIDGIPFVLNGDARALSGTEYRFAADTEFNRQIRDNAWLFAAAAVDLRRYALSAKARDQAETLRASDLRYDEAELTLGATVFPSRDLGPLTVSISGGRGWYGGDPLVDFLRFSADQMIPLNPKNRLTLAFAADHQERVEDTINSSTGLTLQGAWQHTRPSGDNWQAALALNDTASDGAAVARSGWTGSLQYARAKPVLGSKLNLSFDYEQRRYDEPFFSSTKRADQRYRAEASFLLHELETYGFAPKIGLSAQQTSSNIGIYETENFGISFGLRSVF